MRYENILLNLVQFWKQSMFSKFNRLKTLY